ncbi:hypothetical protein B0H19DRAFT_1234131 [Mycena capillaripes]|nr:hypothetical protein B0H19DRAFT_1234131 [Mycena capillaripes]
MAIIRSLSFLLATSTFIAAIPTLNNSVSDTIHLGPPEDATHLSFDNETGEITAYKGTKVLGKYRVPESQPQSRDAGSQWLDTIERCGGCRVGNGLSRGGHQSTGDPSQTTCSTDTVTGNSCWVDANAANEIGFWAEISAEIEIPDIAKVGATYSTSVTFTNSQDSSTSSTESVSACSTTTPNIKLHTDLNEILPQHRHCYSTYHCIRLGLVQLRFCGQLIPHSPSFNYKNTNSHL